MKLAEYYGIIITELRKAVAIMTRKIYFDMDGTIFDLYGKSNWLEQIENEESEVFKGNFLPEINIVELNKVIGELSILGVQFGIITWLPMGASPEYEEICRAEKLEWIKKNMPCITEFNCTSYGIPKQKSIQKRTKQMFLIDDNLEVCKAWDNDGNRIAININKKYTVVNALIKIRNEIEKGLF